MGSEHLCLGMATDGPRFLAERAAEQQPTMIKGYVVDGDLLLKALSNS